MKHLFLALILTLGFPGLALAAEDSPEAVSPVPLDSAQELVEPRRAQPDWAQSASTTTFQYRGPDENEAADPAAEPRQLQRSRSRPKVVTYGTAAPEEAAGAAEKEPVKREGRRDSQVTTFEYTPPAPAEEPKEAAKAEAEKPAAEEEPVKREQSPEPQVTTFEYSRPAPAEEVTEAAEADPADESAPEQTTEADPAEKVETPVKEPEPQAAEADPAQPAEATAEADQAQPAEAMTEEPETQAAEAETSESEKVKTPAEPQFTTLNQRSEELAMAAPDEPAPAVRTRRARKAPASAPPPLPTPAFDGSTSFNVSGIYVNCPDNEDTACGQAAEDFKQAFPKDQTAPYLMLRKNGQGYLAPDSRRTVALTWQFLGDNALLIIMEDARHRKLEYRSEGRYLRNLSTGDLFYLSLTDDEWNVEPEPFSQLQARREKEARERAKKDRRK